MFEDYYTLLTYHSLTLTATFAFDVEEGGPISFDAKLADSDFNFVEASSFLTIDSNDHEGITFTLANPPEPAEGVTTDYYYVRLYITDSE